jgi:peptide/nickel transport system substrate-binding protein
MSAEIRVEGDQLSITLVRPAPDFPARISAGWFTAVPLGTPIYRHGVEQPIPSAGPYYISSHIVATQLVLRPNPNYRGPRPQKLNGIVIAINVPEETGVAQVERGDSDHAFSEKIPLPPDFAPGGRLDRRFGPDSTAAAEGGQRYFPSQVSAIEFLDLNARRGLFSDARLRRAVNFALDRPALAAPLYGSPWDSMLPPGIPGAGDEPTYPLDGPDLAKARALAGDRGGRAVLFQQSERWCPVCPNLVAVIKKNLAAIGIDVRARAFDEPWVEAEKPGVRVDMLLGRWYVDFPDPANFVNGLLDADQPLGYGYPPLYSFYDDARFLERMRAAYRLYGEERASAYRDLVGDMTRDSPPSAVFMAGSLPVHFFSDRVDPDCVVTRPQDGGQVDLAALCLRD